MRSWPFEGQFRIARVRLSFALDTVHNGRFVAKRICPMKSHLFRKKYFVNTSISESFFFAKLIIRHQTFYILLRFVAVFNI